MKLFQKLIFFIQRFCPNQIIHWTLKSKEPEYLNKYLSEIPSETSLNERLFLYWLAREWVKGGLIVELGPFLGGTTRALAKGAEDNFNNVKIITIDQFESYYTARQFIEMNVPISNNNKLDDKINFLSIFNTYHEEESYFNLIETINMKVADNRLDESNYDFIPKEREISALFIDGCKSWYSVVDFIGNLCRYTPVGSYYIFQDYGRFTCFWIPTFLEIFKEHFTFIGCVNSTYAFKLVKSINRELIEDRYKDTPNEMSRCVMEDVFNNLINRSIMKKDHREQVVLTIQKAGFLAYVDNKFESKQLLVGLLRENFVRNNLKKMVKEALISPTYSPEGSIYI